MSDYNNCFYNNFNNLNGSKIIDFKTSKTEFTAIPTSLKGNRNSQTRGYNSNTPIAIGNDIIAKRTHKINVSIFVSNLVIAIK